MFRAIDMSKFNGYVLPKQLVEMSGLSLNHEQQTTSCQGRKYNLHFLYGNKYWIPDSLEKQCCQTKTSKSLKNSDSSVHDVCL